MHSKEIQYKSVISTPENTLSTFTRFTNNILPGDLEETLESVIKPVLEFLSSGI